MTDPTIIPRAEHRISRDNIDDNALKVLYRLQRAGYRALLVGGSVRDLLLNHVPKDFDIATDAHPEQVKRLFSNCRLIGRRFRLAHVFFGREVIEVATFRASHSKDDDNRQHTDSGRILHDNEYGDVEDDVWRRDFTVNALYYDIADFSVVDYTGAMVDIEQRVLRMIGDPYTRYREDPVRMLRAIRFAAKLNFSIHPDSEKPIFELGPLLQDIPAARLYEEVLKLFHSGHAVACLELLEKYQLLQYLFPLAAEALVKDAGTFQNFLLAALQSTDKRVQQDMPITPAFLFAAMLWQSVQQKAEHYRETLPGALAMQNAMSDVISDQVRATSIPRRFSTVIRDIWHMQHRFSYRHGQRARGLLTHPKFRAAYDFYCLRHQAGELEGDGCEWWTRLQTLSPEQQQLLLQPANNPPRKRSRKKPHKAD